MNCYRENRDYIGVASHIFQGKPIKMSEKYLESCAKSIEKASLILEEGDGALYLGGPDEIWCGTASEYDHIISVSERGHVSHESIKSLTSWDIHDYEDLYHVKINTIFDKVTADIHELIENGKKVYVHCFIGKSRAASIVVAYVIKYGNLGWIEAKELVENKRQICINPGFNEQLSEYELSLRQ